jgi:tetratricopeptide (TPR) repeat protein
MDRAEISTMTEDALFAAVLGRPPADRPRFLGHACGTDAALLRRLQLRLADHERAVGGLDQRAKPPGSGEETAGYGFAAEQVGTVVAGRYKLLEQIGEGGMGTVWVAEQTQPVRRKVALKLIKAGMDSKTVLSRFEAERQALALMDHPNIAKVLDGGTTESGRPFFVMEYVKGVPFTAYCDDARLSIPERLGLFVAVCQAVQHAHQKGIIHRDLKPSNILICLYDGRPEPKVIDFGLAKAMHQPLTEHTLYTAHGLMMGTPLYMSPEQAEFNNLDVDTRTDIYALGVILYELLTGTTPLEKERFTGAAWHEMLRLIKDEVPPRPSARLSGSGSLPGVAAQRHVEPFKLTKLVRGELDWIVMKCLEKERSRRYETANGLARDVQRYLADEVVEARPPSASYRLRKLARRYRGTLATVAGFAGLLVVGAVVLAWQAVRATRAEARAAAERDAAQEARQRADRNFATARDAVERYLSKVTDNPNLTQADFHRLRKELLETALPFFLKLVEQEGSDPELRGSRGQAHYRLARLRAEMGDREKAVADFRRALEILEPLAAEFPAVAQYRQALALSRCYHGYVLTELGRPAEAEDQFRKGIAILEQLVEVSPTEPQYREELAESHNGLGNLLMSNASGNVPSYLGQTGEAEAQYQKALALREKLAADFPIVARYYRDVGGALNNLAGIRNAGGKRTDAVALYERAILYQERALERDPKDPKSRGFLCNHHNNLAHTFSELGRWAEAADEYGKAVVGFEKLADEFPAVLVHRARLGDSRMSLGLALADLGRWDEAEAQHRKAKDLQEKLAADFPTDADTHRDLGGSLDNLALVMQRTDRRTEASALYERAIRRGEQALALNPQDPDARSFQITHFSNLGILLTDLGRRDEAGVYLRRSVDLGERLVAEIPHDFFRRDLAVRQTRLGSWLADLGRWDEAEAEHRKALAILDDLAVRSPEMPVYRIDQAGSRVALGHQLRDRAHPDEALRGYREAIEAVKPILAKEDRYVPARDVVRNAYSGRARALDRLGRYAEAVQDWEQAVDLDDGGQRAVLQLGRAISQAHVSGDHRQALAEAEALAQDGDGAALTGMARLCALASTPLAGGQGTDAAAPVREEYAARAVMLLRQAASKGSRDTLYLKQGTDLAPLRDRKDFRTLLEGTDGTTDRPGP